MSSENTTTNSAAAGLEERRANAAAYLAKAYAEGGAKALNFAAGMIDADGGISTAVANSKTATLAQDISNQGFDKDDDDDVRRASAKALDKQAAQNARRAAYRTAFKNVMAASSDGDDKVEEELAAKAVGGRARLAATPEQREQWQRNTLVTLGAVYDAKFPDGTLEFDREGGKPDGKIIINENR